MTTSPPTETGCDHAVEPWPDDRPAVGAEDGPELEGGAVEAMRRAFVVMPELSVGVRVSIALALVTAAGRVLLPILVQQVLDRGVLGPSGFRAGFVYTAAAVGAVLTIGFWVVGWMAHARLTRAAEAGLAGLRLRTFAHIHRLSVAEHNESRRGVLVSRVTSDVETLAQFWQWGAMIWITSVSVIAGVAVVMLVYSWQLTILTVAIFVPLVAVLRVFQRRQLAAWDVVRTRVGDTLAEFSEMVGGAPVIRAHGLERRGRRRLVSTIDSQLAGEVRACRVFALMFPIGDLFGALAIAAVAAVGVWQGPDWGLGAGELVAFLFLVTLLLTPIGSLGEVLDQTQNAAAGLRKVLGVLDLEVEVADPVDGRPLPGGALPVEVRDVAFAYRGGGTVLADISVSIPAGASVAVVGETGSGKTTFAKLLCRLADPSAGSVEVGGVDLRRVDGASRLGAIRLVPQDGFLFDATVAENLRFGRLEADDADITAAIEGLGLGWWVRRLPEGLRTVVAERGGNLSVGERQLVALVRAQLSDPGLLILDEATSAVDPETEQALAGALARLAAGRTTVTVAHRLSTAEHADIVLVFDQGRIVERGRHRDLVDRGGFYARLHASWMGGTRTA